ncbi:hypothetical protein Tco_0917495 [Tanacetum coccineum]
MQDCWVNLDHPLSYALTTIADVYMDMFKDILHLLVKTPENPFVAPVNIETIEAFMNRVFNRCLTTRTSGHDQKKINILQLFHALINRINVDYAALLWWDFMNNVNQNKEAIQYPRFIKLIIADLIKKFPSIPQRIEEDYHSIKDDILLVSVYTTGNVLVRGMLILDAFLTEEVRSFDDFKEYKTVFVNVDVLMNQPQLVVSTQGIHSSPQKSLKITTRQQKVVEGEKDDDDTTDRLEPGSHKDNPEHVDDDDDDKNKEKVDKEEGGVDGYRTTPNRVLRRMCRRQGYMIQNMERKCVTTKQFWKTYTQVNQVLHEGVSQLAEKATEDLIENNLKPCIATMIIEDRDAFCSEVPDLVSQEFNAQAPKIVEELFKNYVLKHKFKKSSTSNTSCRDDDIHSQRHDDHQEDDAPPEGEKRVKRHKTSKKQQQQQKWDAWVEETVIDEDEVIPEDETPKLITELQDVDKRVPTIYDYARMKATLNDALSNRFKNAEEYAYHLEQTTNVMENQIVWESIQEDIRRPVPRPLVFFGPQRNPNEPPSYLYKKDLFFLKYENTEEKKNKVNYREIELMNSLITFIRIRVIWERVHDFQLRIESYQIKVNLIAPTLTFPDSGANERPPMLEKGNHIPWESRFRRFLDNKLEERERMWNSIQNGPYVRQMIPDPDGVVNINVTVKQRLEPLSKMTEGNKKQYIVDVKVMNYILQAIPNDIYNSVDACKMIRKCGNELRG